LSKADQSAAQVRANESFAQVLTLLLGAVQEFAAAMQKILRSTFKPDVRTFSAIRSEVLRASDLAAKLGPQGVVIVRLCGNLRDQIYNLERLAKPKKKDFGTLSGIVASALFLPLFLVTSWANQRFAMGLSGGTVMYYTGFLALIGGFGYGALKFKSIFKSIFSMTETANGA
jgi:hypothetical protein